ncbi:hypothetical protein KSS87_022730 [Heliosperma pusillum]|nr:hypothetical protein KSS87_022730 [Heliosperma pusillum]
MPMKNLYNEVSIEIEKDVLQSVNTPSFMSSLNTPFEGLAFGATSVTTVAANSSPPRPMSFFGCFSSKNKRVSEDHNILEDSCVDRRYKRMMKNRESAARSRSRRQAYTSELEREIAELLKENAKLRKQQLEDLPEKERRIHQEPPVWYRQRVPQQGISAQECRSRAAYLEEPSGTQAQLHQIQILCRTGHAACRSNMVLMCSLGATPTNVLPVFSGKVRRRLPPEASTIRNPASTSRNTTSVSRIPPDTYVVMLPYQQEQRDGNQLEQQGVAQQERADQNTRIQGVHDRGSKYGLRRTTGTYSFQQNNASRAGTTFDVICSSKDSKKEHSQ